MKSIFVAKVYESNETHLADRGRNVGWNETFEKTEEMLHNFGDECRWSFAVIEESAPGMHGTTLNQWWFVWQNIDEEEMSGWIPYPEPKEKWTSFMRCVNHTIG